jgi:hypothetical protein
MAEQGIWDKVKEASEKALNPPNSGYAAPPPTDAELKEIAKKSKW